MPTITTDVLDNLEQAVSVSVLPEDYRDSYLKALKEVAKKAQIQGFRKGKVPPALIERMYGKSVLSDEVFRLAEQSLLKHLEDNKVSVLYQPVLEEADIRPENWKKDQPVTLRFLLGLQPEISLDFLKDWTLDTYEVQLAEEAVAKEILYYQKLHAAHEEADSITDKEHNYLLGTASVLEKAVPFTLYLSHLEDSAFEKFKTLQKDAAIQMSLADIQEAHRSFYVGRLFTTEAEKASQDKDFSFQLRTVKLVVPHPLDAALFKKVFPENPPVDGGAFEERVQEKISAHYQKEARHWAYSVLSDKIKKNEAIALPFGFIRRWVALQQKKQQEQKTYTDAEWRDLYELVRYKIVEQAFVAQRNIAVQQEELTAFARAKVQVQFARYALPSEELDKLAHSALKDSSYMHQVSEELLREKVLEQAYSEVQQEKKSIPQSDFETLLAGYYKNRENA